MIGVALAGIFLFAPDRIKNQTLAAIGFLGSSLSHGFEVARDKIMGGKEFIDSALDPKSPQEKRAEILENLSATVAKIENPRTSASEKQKLASQAAKLVEEVKKENEDKPGFIQRVVSTISGSDNSCETEK